MEKHLSEMELHILLNQYQTDPSKIDTEKLDALVKQSQNYQKKENVKNFQDEIKKILNEYDINYLCYIQGSGDIKKLAEKKLFNMLQSSDIVSTLLIEKRNLREKMLFDKNTSTWFLYELDDVKFVWAEADVASVQTLILQEIAILFPSKLKNKGFKKLSTINDILAYLSLYLQTDISKKKNNHIYVYKDKAIELVDQMPVIKDNCKPNDFIFNYNPIPWEEGAKCPKIKDWLKKKFHNDADILNLFLAVCAIILRSNAHPFNLQIFLEIHGAPKAGKSLLGRLLQAIVGPKGFCASNMEKLAKNFELDKLVGKNLCIMPDQQTFAGNIETFKALTGCDTVTARPIYGKSFEFRFYGLLVLITNYPTYWGAVESAINRRKLSIEFPEAINEKLNTQILDFDKSTGEPIGEWKDELPGFIQWVFKLTPEQIKDIILNETSKNERTPAPFTYDAYIKNHLMPCKGGKVGFYTNKYGPPLFNELENYQKQVGRKLLSPTNLLNTIKQDFSLQWPQYTIEIEETSEGPILYNVMYQNVLNKDQWTLFRALFKYHYDKNFFGKYINMKHQPFALIANEPSLANRMLKTNLHDNPKIEAENNDKIARHNLYKQLVLLTQENDPVKVLEKLMEKVGTPTVKGNSKYNYKLIQQFQNKEYESFLKGHSENEFTILSVNDQEKFLEKCIFDWFEPCEESKMPTSEILRNFEYYTVRQNFQVIISESTFKSKVKKAFSNVYPDAKPLKDVKNIKPDNLNGLQGLKLKDDI